MSDDASRRMQLQADLLAEGFEPDEITILAMAHRRMIELINQSVAFELIANNIDRPDAAKYGTHPDGSPRHAPEWYLAQGIKTGIHEGLYGTLKEILGCPSVGPEGVHCIGALLHDGWHWDGEGENWLEEPRDV